MSTQISIIIPTYNEAAVLKESLVRCVGVTKTETIVVDGGSDDGTRQLATDLGAHVLRAPRGRSLQMNLGADNARGEMLLFLHADTHLPDGFDEHIVSTLQRLEVSAGAFQLRIRGKAKPLRLIELGVRVRSTFLQVPYGDQAIFLRAATFKQLAGFKEIEIMEDFDLVRRLRRIGRIEIVNASVLTSARRWERVGILRTTLINQIAIAAYLVGVSPARIASFYEKDRSHSE